MERTCGHKIGVLLPWCGGGSALELERGDLHPRQPQHSLVCSRRKGRADRQRTPLSASPPQASGVSHRHAWEALTRDSPCIQHTNMPHCWPTVWAVPRGVEAGQAPNNLVHLSFVQCRANHDGATTCPHGKHRPHFAGTQYVLALRSTTAATFGANGRA